MKLPNIFLLSLALCTLQPICAQNIHHTAHPPIERLYVHQDRNHYVAGEVIWLKVYRLTEATAQATSQTVYVDVADHTGKIVAEAKYPFNDGMAAGRLELPKDLESGNYRLRAYTQWMRNFDEEGFYRRELTVKNPKDKTDIAPSESPAKATVRFFPEGGNLIGGLPQKVAFEVSGCEGQTVGGCLLTQTGDTVKHFKAEASEGGRGSFFITPEAGTAYTAHLQGQAEAFPFPQAAKQGFVVNAKHLAQIVRITVSHNFADGQAPRNCTLLLRKEEQTLGNFAIDTASPHQIIDLPKKQLPAGVLTFSLIDPAGHVYAERLVMARYPETASPDIHAKVNHDETLRQLHIEFTTPKGEKAEAGTYSIAIVEEAWDNTPDRYHLASYQALGGHLRGDIPDIGRYWRPDDEKSLLDIDLLLLTHGWRRYSLANIRHEADTRAEGFHMEQSLSLTGRVNARKSQAEGMVVQAIVRKDTTQQVVICPVDEELRFSLNGFHFTGWSEVLLSAKNGESKEFPIEIDKPAESPTASPFDRQTVWTMQETGTTQTVTVEADTILISPQEMMRHVQVSEVEVTADKRDPIEKRRNYSTEFVKVSFEAPKQGFAGDIRRLMQRVPGIRMVPPPSEQGFIKPPKAVINGYPNRAYATLVLNGMVIRDVESVYSMDAANVERIEVLQPTATMFGGMNSKNGIICIYTRLGGGEPIDPTRTIHQWIGYNQVKEFYAPHPGNREFFAKPRRRHTLYWNPQTTTDEQGNTQFSIYLNDAENGRYTLHCEGYTESGRTVTINTAIIF